MKSTKAVRREGVARPGRARRTPALTKSEATRAHVYETALALFQKRGVDGTTMRDIAEAAGMSLGAAYYYFPSKEALVFAYYEENQAVVERLEVTGGLREQLGTLMHAKLESIRDQRHMLGTILPRLMNPGDELSAFSSRTKAVRARAIGLFARPLREAGLGEDVVRVAAHALWMFQLAALLVYLNDTSAQQKRTHGLIDDALDMLVPMLPMLGTPIGKNIVERVTAALDRAGIAML
jgi:AcrR family transcriptional regulator